MMRLLALTSGVEAAAQKHRHTPQPQTGTELVDSTNKDAIDAFSDTTSVASQTPSQPVDKWDWDDDDDDFWKVIGNVHNLDSLQTKSVFGMLFVLGVLLIIFVISTFFIFITFCFVVLLPVRRNKS